MAAPGHTGRSVGTPSAEEQAEQALGYWAILGAFIVAGRVVAYVVYENLGADPIDAE